MNDLFNPLAARAIDAVRIHHICRENRHGRPGFVKQRRFGLGVVIWCGNRFLDHSHSGIRMFVSVTAWQAHEASIFRLCHPGRVVERLGASAIFFEELPGLSLRQLHQQSRLDDDALTCAGQEMRRAHQLQIPGTAQAWSHGDPHLGNLLYDPASRRCYLIDFETTHHLDLPAPWRQADDLLVLSLELLATGEMTRSLHLAETFLRAYDCPAIVEALYHRLKVPTGLERILWATRTNYLSTPALKLRLEALRSLIVASSFLRAESTQCFPAFG